MRIFLLLLVCFIISSHQVSDSIKIKKNALFLDKVSDQCFRYEKTYTQFIDNGLIVSIKEGYPFDTNKVKEFKLYAVFTSSKAIYYSKEEEKYIGFVIVDNLLYSTRLENSLEKINFYRLFYFGMKNPYDV